MSKKKVQYFDYVDKMQDDRDNEIRRTARIEALKEVGGEILARQDGGVVDVLAIQNIIDTMIQKEET